jgi:XTP/dITP diphosphohydrolase
MAKERDLLRTITFITGNQHKVKEARGICQLFNIKVDNYNLGYPELSVG